MSDDDERIREILHQKRDLEGELKRIETELVPTLLKRLSATAGHIGQFDLPSAERVGGALWHAARCTDPAGKRLRDALGTRLHTADQPETASIVDDLMPVLLHLNREPDPKGLKTIEELGLSAVFPPGRWRPCALYSGTVAPERLVSLVLTYGGDCYALRRPKRATASEDES